MNIKVIKRNTKYYIEISNFSVDLVSYDLKKFLDHKFSVYGEININLLENDIDLLSNDIDLNNHYIEIPFLDNVKDFFILTIKDKNNLEYRYYIDINKFYGLKDNDSIYFYNLDENEISIEDVKEHKYDIYLFGIYGDRHKVRIIDIESDKRVLFVINNKDRLISEVYDIIFDLNHKEIYRDRIAIFHKDSIDFVTNIEDLSNYVKCEVLPKYRYPQLINVKIKDKNTIINEYKKTDSNKDKLTSIVFYIPKEGDVFEKNIDIEYEVLENRLGTDSIFKTKNITLSSNKNNEISINDLTVDYNYETSNYTFNWTTSFNSYDDITYMIEIDNHKFYTKDNFISVKDDSSIIKSLFVDVKIYIKNEISYKLMLSKNIKNVFLNTEDYDFNPVIDYSDIYKKKDNFVLNWTVPSYDYYVSLKTSSLFHSKFLEEFLIPNTKFVETKFNKPVSEFNYDTEEDIKYNENIDGQFYKKAKNMPLCYDIETEEFFIGKTNHIELPKWVLQENEKYTIEVSFYNKWNVKKGSSKVEITDIEKPTEIGNLYFKRDQKFMFGETGTVGEFYLKEKPTPLDSYRAYSDDMKTYTNLPLFNYSNTDFENTSLYYYCNSNDKEKELKIKLERIHNMKKIKYSLVYLKTDLTIIEDKIFEFNGNDFEDNIIPISNQLLEYEGEYKMILKPYNSTNVDGQEKTINFYVYNEKPVIPEIRIMPSDYELDEDSNIIINKKYFTLEITNNTQSTKYAGWVIKESHFFFKKKNTSYNSYPDYVAYASKDSGSIVMKNNVPIENGEYEVKVVNYDYSGNASVEKIMKFHLISQMSATPNVFFTNKLNTKIEFQITKSQDSEGYFRYLMYSKDGINYEKQTDVKVKSPYYVNDSTTKKQESINIDLLWNEEQTEYLEGYYKLGIYEYNIKHPNGIEDYSFYSDVIEVNKQADISNAVYCKEIDNKVAIFNKRSKFEYAYASELDDLVFNTINSVYDENDDISKYTIKLISPTGTSYKTDLPKATEIGVYSFDKIATKLNIVNEIEGLWTLEFIITDKYGNNNELFGFYTYKILIVKRNPQITLLSPNNGTNSEYFGRKFNSVGYIVYTDCYSDIQGFEEHKDKFDITTFKTMYISSPINNTDNRLKMKENNIVTLEDLSEFDKEQHIKDGKYTFSIKAIDPIGRMSTELFSTFYIDTDLGFEISFLNPDQFKTRDVELVASLSENVVALYYQLTDETETVGEEFTKVIPEEISYNNSTFNGIKIKEHFESNGVKQLSYYIEENSGNISETNVYSFKINDNIKFAPIFDYENKVYFLKSDEEIKISWNLSPLDYIEKFYVLLEKIKMDDKGNFIVEKTFRPNNSFPQLLLEVGANDNNYYDIEKATEYTFNLSENTIIEDGYYRFRVIADTIYGTTEENNFKFQIYFTNFEPISDHILNNKITLDYNKISWDYILNAIHYEYSYDNNSFTRTYNNFVIVDKNKLIYDNEGKSYIYLRYRSKFGVFSETNKIEIALNVNKLETPEVGFYLNKDIIDDNKMIKWKVTVKDPLNANYLFYSFDKEHWNVKKVTGTEMFLVNTEITYPVTDGIYDVFVRTTNENPLEETIYNKSDLAHSKIKIFASSIDKPLFKGIENGVPYSVPVKLYISNKQPNITYYLYVNDKLVNEGYEIASYDKTKFVITVRAKKNGIDKVFDLITKDEDFHIYSIITNKEDIVYLGDRLVKCVVDSVNKTYVVKSLPNIKQTQTILYKEKDTNEWNILSVNDSLSLFKNYEFHIVDFKIK